MPTARSLRRPIIGQDDRESGQTRQPVEDPGPVDAALRHQEIEVRASQNYREFLDLWKNADPSLPQVEDVKKRLAGLGEVLKAPGGRIAPPSIREATLFALDRFIDVDARKHISLKLESKKTYTIEFKKEGFRSVTKSITNHVCAGWIVLDVLMGLVPVIIDAATGAWYSLDQKNLDAVLEKQKLPL
jgi:hypothetical protein